MDLIDNINRRLGDDLLENIRPGARIRIAAPSFSIFAFEALREALENIDSLQFIFTAPTFTPDEVTGGGKKVPREYFIPKSLRERSVHGTEFEIRLRNRLTGRAVAKECADWIARRATFRSKRTQAPMPMFAGVAAGGEEASEIVYAPLGGFTAVDLGYQPGDAVASFVQKFDLPAMVAPYRQTFDQVWNDDDLVQDVTERLREHIASVYRENSPQRIYYQTLHNIFGEFLEDVSGDNLPNDRTGYLDSLVWQRLYNFQRDAATGIINKLETFNGCILADSVGLGKTFTALAVIKYYELRNRTVLVLCPKKLADNWLTFNRNVKTNPFVRDRFNYEVLAHTDLSRDRGDAFGTRLDQINWGNYDLVVIDESHNFRNADTFDGRETRYQRLMDRVIRSGVQTKVLMLSATPVNNRFGDLKNQLALAYEGDAESINEKLNLGTDIGEVFRRAQRAFNEWTDLPPDERTGDAILRRLDFDFFKMLDSVTIARSRRHITTFYDTGEIGSFPRRLPPKSYRCPLTHRDDVPDLNHIYRALSSLSLAVYAPLSYVHPSRLPVYAERYDTRIEGDRRFRQIDREQSLQRLMTTNLLKRLESSVEAFRLTLAKLARGHRSFLDAVDRFEQTGDATFIGDRVADASVGFAAVDGADDVIDPSGEEAIDTGKIRIDLRDMDLVSWRRALETDLAVIDELLIEMKKVGPGDDAKLQQLLSFLADKMRSPINAGNRKVLIFTAFADTAEYLYRHIATHRVDGIALEAASVSGTFPPRSTLRDAAGNPRHDDFQTLLTLFSPRSKQRDVILPDETESIDVLIGTDCISEGQNLQDCDCVVNYDIHWNPVRIIQRFGRIDRIGSTNDVIQLVNFWPDISLDEYINLKERVEDRMVIADMTATGDDNVLLADPNAAGEVAYRREQLRRLQDEVIEMEDVKTGVSITDLGLNDFRMDLLGYVKTHGDLRQTPNGLHAVVPADPAIGLEPGVIFTLRNRHPEMAAGRSNRLHPYYLIYVGTSGDVVVDPTQIKRILDLARASCRDRDRPVAAACGPFNAATDDGRDMSAYSRLLDIAVESIIDAKHNADVDSLFAGGQTSALRGDVQGRDDFELITFLVVQPTDANRPTLDQPNADRPV